MNRDRLPVVFAILALCTGIAVSVARTGRADDPGSTLFQPIPDSWTRRSLRPVPNPDQYANPQPHRCRPYRVAASADGRRAWITLSGKEIRPGSEVAVLDVPARRETCRVTVGRYPFAVRMHPSGRWVAVTNRYSNFLSVIDAATNEVTSEIPVPFYCEELEFSPDGRLACLASFRENQVFVVDLREENGRLTGRMRELGFDRTAFRGDEIAGIATESVCRSCG
ncbi:MAG: surface antigen, partial [Planctomycetota bacterium]